MATTLTDQDQQLREAVAHQLEWDPEVDASLIGITARSGIVTLSGYVETYLAKLAAERAVRGVSGVKAVANELEVRLAQVRIDPEIATDAMDALANRLNVPRNVSVTVRDGFVTLAGDAEWMFEKVAAERAVKPLRGVRGVFNHIRVAPKLRPQDIQKRITQALHRQADVNAHRIHVEATGGTVKLTGAVETWRERNDAARAAWAAPGVETVENRLEIVPL
jgi:osmotically-inducible protein OsmY